MEPEKKKKKYVEKKIKYVQSFQKVDLQDNPIKKQGKDKTRVINVKVKYLREQGYENLQKWLQDPQHIYVGRDMTHYVPAAVGSKWANPFKVQKHGRAACIQKYKKYILSNKELMGDVKSLKGKVLGCWCAPQGCHGDVLAQLAQQI